MARIAALAINVIVGEQTLVTPDVAVIDPAFATEDHWRGDTDRV